MRTAPESRPRGCRPAISAGYFCLRVVPLLNCRREKLHRCGRKQAKRRECFEHGALAPPKARRILRRDSSEQCPYWNAVQGSWSAGVPPNAVRRCAAALGALGAPVPEDAHPSLSARRACCPAAQPDRIQCRRPDFPWRRRGAAYSYSGRPVDRGRCRKDFGCPGPCALSAEPQ